MSGALGDFFPRKIKEELAKENVKPGAVIRIRVPDTTPPKIKLLVIIGIDEDNALMGTLFVNSDINPNVLNTQELVDLQYNLLQKDCPYLQYDSYADCSRLRERNYQDVLKLIEKSPADHLGDISANDFDKIKNLVKNARTISTRMKKRFGLL